MLFNRNIQFINYSIIAQVNHKSEIKDLNNKTRDDCHFFSELYTRAFLYYKDGALHIDNHQDNYITEYRKINKKNIMSILNLVKQHMIIEMS